MGLCADDSYGGEATVSCALGALAGAVDGATWRKGFSRGAGGVRCVREGGIGVGENDLDRGGGDWGRQCQEGAEE